MQRNDLRERSFVLMPILDYKFWMMRKYSWNCLPLRIKIKKTKMRFSRGGDFDPAQSDAFQCLVAMKWLERKEECNLRQNNVHTYMSKTDFRFGRLENNIILKLIKHGVHTKCTFIFMSIRIFFSYSNITLSELLSYLISLYSRGSTIPYNK